MKGYTHVILRSDANHEFLVYTVRRGNRYGPKRMNFNDVLERFQLDGERFQEESCCICVNERPHPCRFHGEF